MKVKQILRSSRNPEDKLPNWFPGWFDARFGDHYAQISVDTTLKLKSAVRDVSRAMRRRCEGCGFTYETPNHVPKCEHCGSNRVPGFVPADIEELSKKFMLPPQGVSDYNFVMGYAADEGWVPGSSTDGHEGTDQALLTYIERYPEDWEVVKRCLGLARQKGRHACFPGEEAIFLSCGKKAIIQDCDGKEILTGSKRKARAKLLNQGMREVFEYTMQDGSTIRVTADHLVMTQKGWMEIQQAMDQNAELVLANVDAIGSEARLSRTQETVEDD